MKRKTSLCLSLVTLAGLLGCSTRVPMVQYHDGLSQKKVQALKHWDLMAKEVATKIASNPDFAGQSLVVNQPTNASAFLVFFDQMIKTELLNSNVVHLATTPEAPLTLEVYTQLVRHSQRFGWYPSAGLVGGDFLNNLLWGGNPSSFVGGAVGSVFNLITGQSFGTPRETASELLVLSLVKKDGVPQMAVKQIVYVDRAEDVALYWRPARYLSNQPVSNLKVTTTP